MQDRDYDGEIAALKVERDAAVERAEKAEEQHYPVYIASLLMTLKREAEEQHARAARLAEAIEKAPHGIGCSFVAWCGPGTSRTPGPCDCWKSALSAQEKGKPATAGRPGASKVADQVKP